MKRIIGQHCLVAARKASIVFPSVTRFSGHTATKAFRNVVAMANTPAAKTALQELGKDGAFVRTAAGFRNHIEEGGKFAPERLGSFPPTGCIPDTVNNAKFIRDLYEMSHDTTGKYSVPVLWDKKEKCIVNNESAEIVRMLNSQFNKWAKNPSLDLYPEPLRAEIDSINEWVYPTINNGVYRCGFATKQEAYDLAFSELFASLDRVESMLGKYRYIAGNQLTEADIRLFVTLIRFDEVYVVYFKTNKKFLREYPNIREYVKDMYQTPNISKSINMYHIKTHYFTSHPKLNAYAIVPKGGDPWWELPHDRERFTSPHPEGSCGKC